MDAFRENFQNVVETPAPNYYASILPSLLGANMIAQMNTANAFETHIGSLLYVVFNFLVTRNIGSCAYLLGMETICLLIAYKFSKHLPLTLFLLTLHLMSWVLDYRFRKVHHPIALVSRCLAIFLVGFVYDAPEKLVCLILLLGIAYVYIFNFEEKHIDDSILVFGIIQILAFFAFTMKLNYSYVFSVSYFYIIIIFWMLVKSTYLIPQHLETDL